MTTPHPITRPIRAWLALLLLLGGVGQVCGQADSVNMVIDYAGDIVVTAQYAPTSSREALYPIRAIRREEIQQRAAVNLEQLLQQELNIRLTQDLILGSGLSLQGVGGQNVKIMIDGVPVLGRVGDDIDLGQLQLGNIERVEIVEGPLSVPYGTDALGGVINLISRRNQLDRYQVRGSSQWESLGNWNLNVGLGARLKDRLLLQIDGTRYRSEGFNPAPPARPEAERTFQWNPERQRGLQGMLRYDLGADRNLRLRSSLFDETIDNLGILRRPQFKPYAFDDFYHTRRWDQSLHYEGSFLQNLYWNVTGGYNSFRRQKETLRLDFDDASTTPVPGEQDTTRYQALVFRPVLASRFPNARWQFQAGLDINYERGIGPRLADPEAGGAQRSAIADYALFATVEFQPIDSLRIQVGARAAYNTRFDVPIVPSVHLRYDLGPHWRLKASYAAGFRSPSIKELFFYFVDASHFIVGNPDLRPERSHHFQGVLETGRDDRALRWRATATGFYNDMRDRIGLYDFLEVDGEMLPAASLDTFSTQFAYFNQETFRVLGANLRLNLGWRSFDLALGLAPTGRYNPLASEAPVPRYTWATELSGQLRYRIPGLGLQAALFVRYNDRLLRFYQTTDDQGDLTVDQAVQDGFALADLTLTQTLWKGRIDLRGGVKNLLDVRDVPFSGATGGAHSGGGNSAPIARGRFFFLGLDWQLGGN